MALSEIEKLERRYAENPQGLTFAPLAEVHRKNGDITRALELLKPGLELHPDYTPASIVLGRCHLDLGDLPAAESAFTRVLALDGENVIALKALADISERLRRFDDAEQWLRQLIAVDRSNDSAREQLSRLEIARSQTATASAVFAAAAPSEAAATGEPAVAPETAAVTSEGASTVAAPAAQPPPFEPGPPLGEVPEPQPLLLEDLEPSGLSDSDFDLPPEGLQVEETVEFAEPVEPLSGLVGRDVDAEDELVDEFTLETSEDIVLRSAGAGEFSVPNASEELSAREPDFSRFAEEASLAAPSEESPAEASSFAEAAPSAEAPPSEEVSPPAEASPAREAAPEPEPAAPAPADIPPIEPEPVVTATMAEVLLDQGYPTEALEVYRELENRTAGESRFREKIAELEAQTPSPRRSYSAAETQGRPVREFLRELLAARPPVTAAPPVARPAPTAVQQQATGAPTRPAAEALSLSSVFGEEANPSPPAVPAAGSQDAPGVSFDEFFGSPTPGGPPRASKAPDPKSDDLDQFHTWLQNLKR